MELTATRNKMINPFVYAGLSHATKKAYFPHEKAKLIQEQICEHFGCTWDELSNPTRRREVVRKRQIAMYILSRHSGLELKGIGALFTGCPKQGEAKHKDHSTVIHARDKIISELGVYDDVTNTVQAIEMRLKMIF